MNTDQQRREARGVLSDIFYGLVALAVLALAVHCAVKVYHDGLRSIVMPPVERIWYGRR